MRHFSSFMSKRIGNDAHACKPSVKILSNNNATDNILKQTEYINLAVAVTCNSGKIKVHVQQSVYVIINIDLNYMFSRANRLYNTTSRRQTCNVCAHK